MKKYILLGFIGLSMFFVGCSSGSSGSTTYSSETQKVDAGDEVPITNGDVVIVSGDNSGAVVKKAENGGVIVECDAGEDCDVNVGTEVSSPTVPAS